MNRVRKYLGVVYHKINAIYSKWKKSRRLQRYGREVLREVAEALVPLSVTYFADFGTLLGLVRDKGFIKHDYDIDFGIMPGYSDYGKLIEALKAKGFIYKRGFESSGIVTEIAFSYKGLSVDFFFNILEGDRMWYQEYSTGGVIPSPGDSVDVIETIRVYRPVVREIEKYFDASFVVPIPKNAVELLEVTYGESWQTPIPNWRADHADTKLAPRSKVKTASHVIGEKRLFELGCSLIS